MNANVNANVNVNVNVNVNTYDMLRRFVESGIMTTLVAVVIITGCYNLAMVWASQVKRKREREREREE